MIKYLPHPIGTTVQTKKGKIAIVNGFAVRDNGYIYSLTHIKEGYIYSGKSAWHEHDDLKFLREPNLDSLELLDKAGDL